MGNLPFDMRQHIFIRKTNLEKLRDVLNGFVTALRREK